MYKNTAKLKKLNFDPLIFEFYLVKKQGSKLDIYLSGIIDYIPVNKLMDALYPLMKIECSTPTLVVMSMNLA